ncbi:AfsR/SARP family transcriptional regulator [Amycolatopsis samaneae]|uniref:BTAD domain-containing putative transcriptional regulator n=1 Tax=Amycolatopsis samaneae TaxID=664691 RepID=A0ABW5G927_9PSEU
MNGSPVVVTSSRQRALLATLALSAGRLVSIETLARGVWGEAPPERIRGSLQTYVMRLRRLYGEETVATEPDGYRLVAEPADVDALRFLGLVDTAMETAEPDRRRAILGSALALWRGAPLEGAGSPALAAEWVPLLTERYLFAAEQRIDLDSRLVPDARLVAELTELVTQHPLRESLWARLVRILARSGRRAEALAGYARLRELLADELGVEPGEELRRLHAELLAAGEGSLPGNESAGADRPRHGAVPRQLPFDVASFAGRDAELAALDGFLGAGREDGGIVVIEGTAGVGKTSLAVHWSHRVADRFPGGQLFLDLRGHSAETPVTLQAALAGFLRAVGVSPESLPSTVEERSALLRSRLAGSRTLLLLDNARDAEQVRPLLPGPGNLVVVTSRNQLRGLVARAGARRIALGSFGHRDTVALLAGSVGRARLDAEPLAVAELAELCGGLPLALALAGERASRFSGMSLAGIVDELRDQRLRLDALRDPQDAGTDLRAAFSWSYKALRPAAARLFRLLGLHPGLTVSLHSAAALAGTGLREARDLVDQLAAAHLLNQPRADRYQFHDLLRVYAAELVEAETPEEERTSALRRLLDRYLATVAEANELVRPDLLTEDIELEPVGGEGVGFVDHEDTIAWYTAERQALVALVEIAARHGWPARAWKLAWLLRGFFAERHDREEWIATGQTAVEAARAAKDRLGLQYAANNLGSAYLRALQADKALEALEEGKKASEETGGSALTVAILSNLSGAYFVRAEYTDAEQYALEAVRLARERGQRTFVSHALLNVSAARIGLRDFDHAAEAAMAAFDAFTELSDRYHAALSLGNAAEALEGAGRYVEAEVHGLRALAELRELNADYGTIDVLITLGRIRHSTGRGAEAGRHWAEALAVCQRLGDPRAGDIEALLATLPAGERPTPP